MEEERLYWLDGFDGAAKGGTYTRSRIALDINDFETKFKKKVVGIGISNSYDSDKPSWNVDMITEVSEEDKLEAIAQADASGVLDKIVNGTDPIHEAEEEDKA